MENQVALVTGANRGIGFEVCRQLARQKIRTILTARDRQRGEDAVKALAKDGLEVTFCELDVTQSDSIERARDFVNSKFGRLDILINNAGGNYDSNKRPLGSSLQFARETFELNFFSVWAMCQTFYPFLRNSSHGRIVNVSSGSGSLQGMIRYDGAAASYGLSKLALNGLTMKLASELEGTGILVNAVCPGYTQTDLTDRDQAARPVEVGAASVVWAALLPDEGPTGGFFRDGKPVEW